MFIYKFESYLKTQRSLFLKRIKLMKRKNVLTECKTVLTKCKTSLITGKYPYFYHPDRVLYPDEVD